MPSRRPRPARPALPDTDRTAAALAGLGQALARSHDPGGMLAAAIDEVCRALEASGGGFMRHDAEHDELVLEAPAFGVQAEHIVSRYRVPLAAGGNAARVFQSREPTIANDAQHDPRFIQRFVRLFDTRNTITVPLVLHDHAIGIFHAINKRQGDFTAADQALLAALAPTLAACLELVRQRRALDAGQRRRERARALHERLLDGALRARDVDQLGRELHLALARPLLLLDALRRPLSSHAWPLDPAAVARELGRHALRDSRVAHLTLRGTPPRACAAVAITIGAQRAATLLVLTDQAPLDELDERALEQAATLVALEIQRQRSLVAEAGRAANAVLVELFAEGVGEHEAERLLARLAIATRPPWRVVLLELDDGRGALEALAPGQVSLLHEALERALGSLRSRLRLLPWRAGFVAICDAGGAERLGERGQVRRLQQAVDGVEGLAAPLRLHLGIGRAENRAAGLGTSLHSAEQALRMLARLPRRGATLAFEELGVYRLLLGDNRARDHDEFAAEVLGPALRADSRGQLLDSLAALVAHNFNLAAAARELGVHLNTVKYRMQQLREAYGRDPSRGDLRLEIELALRIRQLR